MNEVAQKVKDRLNAFIEHLGVSTSAFEKKCGLSNGYVRNFKGNLGGKKLEDILNAFPQLNREWLLFGNGSMLSDSENQLENPMEEKPEDDSMVHKLLLIVESQRKDIETLIQLIREKDAKIADLMEESMKQSDEISYLKFSSTTYNKGETATSVGSSSLANVGGIVGIK